MGMLDRAAIKFLAFELFSLFGCNCIPRSYFKAAVYVCSIQEHYGGYTFSEDSTFYFRKTSFTTKRTSNKSTTLNQLLTNNFFFYWQLVFDGRPRAERCCSGSVRNVPELGRTCDQQAYKERWIQTANAPWLKRPIKSKKLV